MDGGSARRKATTYTQGNTDTEQTHTNIHACSAVRTHDLSVGLDWLNVSLLQPLAPVSSIKFVEHNSLYQTC
jgi:hypothetical protein